MTGGTYTLLLDLTDSATITVGALGERDFDPGWYAYTGSAFGPGGFARVKRHRELARGDRETRHWHLDYLLGHDGTRIDAVWRTPKKDIECSVAGELPGDPVTSFGSSDCRCGSHLTYAPQRDTLATALDRLHAHRE